MSDILRAVAALLLIPLELAIDVAVLYAVYRFDVWVSRWSGQPVYVPIWLRLYRRWTADPLKERE